MIVTFCGHSEVHDKQSVQEWVRTMCDDLIQNGASEFYFGGYGAFDYLCAQTLRDMKKLYPQIRLILILPYLNSSMATEEYDATIYPPLETVMKRFAISRRNEWMVTNSDKVLAYVTHDWGGAYKTLIFAQRKKKDIILYGE